MSSLSSIVAKSSKSLLIRYPHLTQKKISTSSLRYLKESFLEGKKSRLNDKLDNPDQASQNERHKQDALKKQKEGKGHWKAELASDSEEAIAAERNQRNESLHELQKRTVEHAEDKHRSGTSQGTGL